MHPYLPMRYSRCSGEPIPRRGRIVSVLAALALLLGATAACGDDGPTADDTATTTSVEPEAIGPLTVFAAASLTEPFTHLQSELRISDPHLDLTFSFAGSGTLVTQVGQGAPADVVATADLESMSRLVDAGLVDAPVTFARNRLEILVAPGNPLGIERLADLARDDIRVVLGDETVPVGKYAARILGRAGVVVRPVSRELDVKAAVAKVTSGEADATVVYATDVSAAGKAGTGVEIIEDQNLMAEYPISVVKATRNRHAASLFVEDVVHGAGQRALHHQGFLPAS